MKSINGRNFKRSLTNSNTAIKRTVQLAAVCCILLFAAVAGRAVTLSQNTDQTTIINGNSISCNLAGEHAANSYWRAFTPSALGQAGFFTVTGVRMGVEEATAGSPATSQPITVRIYSNTGPAFPLGAMTLLSTLNTTVANGNLVFKDFVISTASLPVTTQIIVEIFTPDGQTVHNRFFIGSNNLGQSAPGYISAADCGAPIPTNLATAGASNMHMLISLVGFATAAPTAAGATVSGRVINAEGRGIRNALVTITDQRGVARTALSGPLGSYSFQDLPTGQTYVLSIAARRFTFANPTRLISLNDDLAGEDFVSETDETRAISPSRTEAAIATPQPDIYQDDVVPDTPKSPTRQSSFSRASRKMLLKR